MKIDDKKVIKLVIAIIIPLAIGGISALLTMNSMKEFETLNQPPLSPPSIVFPIVWTILYILMGIASYMIYKEHTDESEKLLILYGIQLVFNFLWSPIFFNFKAYWFALFWLLIMCGIILVWIIKSEKVNKNIKWLLIPYLLWCLFALYLNLGVAILN